MLHWRAPRLDSASLIKHTPLVWFLHKVFGCLHHFYVTVDIRMFGVEGSALSKWWTTELSTERETITIVLLTVCAHIVLVESIQYFFDKLSFLLFVFNELLYCIKNKSMAVMRELTWQIKWLKSWGKNEMQLKLNTIVLSSIVQRWGNKMLFSLEKIIFQLMQESLRPNTTVYEVTKLWEAVKCFCTSNILLHSSSIGW